MPIHEMPGKIDNSWNYNDAYIYGQQQTLSLPIYALFPESSKTSYKHPEDCNDHKQLHKRNLKHSSLLLSSLQILICLSNLFISHTNTLFHISTEHPVASQSVPSRSKIIAVLFLWLLFFEFSRTILALSQEFISGIFVVLYWGFFYIISITTIVSIIFC